MEKSILRTTLVFLFHESKILLGYKKRGFGSQKWNGFGGKIMKSETVLEAACRELKEECGVEAKQEDLEKFGLLQFEFEGENLFIEVNAFKTNSFEGTITESEEMKPQWFPISEIPYENMWADDPIWFPYMFNDRSFWAKFIFKGRSEILKYDLEEIAVDKLDSKKYPDS
ncbi:oxidized purine nucleoside triphosphate hydrolase-like [Styela clava]